MRSTNKGTRPHDAESPRPRAGKRPRFLLNGLAIVTHDTTIAGVSIRLWTGKPVWITGEEARQLGLDLLDHAHAVLGDLPTPHGARTGAPASPVAGKSAGDAVQPR